MTFRELYNKLNEKFPDTLRCEWDNDGIMCAADVEKSVEKVVFNKAYTKWSKSDIITYST